MLFRSSVDSIRELVLQGRWATIMPVSVFKELRAAESVVMSEVSGVQLNRLLVLATRIERRDNPALQVIQEMIESEFSRLARRGMFSFTSTGPGDGGRAQK